MFVDDDRLLVACIDMPEHELEDEMRLRYGVPMRPVLATPRSISQAISKYYAPGMRDEAIPYPNAVAAAAPPPTKSGKPAKAGQAAPSKSEKAAKPAAKAAPAGARFEDLNADEKQKRKQIGLIAMSWSILIPCIPLLIWGVWPTSVLTLPGFIFKLPWLAALTAPATIFYVTQKYWK